MKITLLVELEYDGDAFHGTDQESIDWFHNEILSGGKGKLLLHSNEVCDTIGKIKVINRRKRWTMIN